MTAKKRPADPLASLRVKVTATLGDTSFEVDCTLSVAAEVAARLHVELERMVALKPNVAPRADGVPAGTIYVDDGEGDGYRRRRGVGFG